MTPSIHHHPLPSCSSSTSSSTSSVLPLLPTSSSVRSSTSNSSCTDHRSRAASAAGLHLPILGLSSSWHSSSIVTGFMIFWAAWVCIGVGMYFIPSMNPFETTVETYNIRTGVTLHSTTPLEQLTMAPTSAMPLASFEDSSIHSGTLVSSPPSSLSFPPPRLRVEAHQPASAALRMYRSLRKRVAEKVSAASINNDASIETSTPDSDDESVPLAPLPLVNEAQATTSNIVSAGSSSSVSGSPSPSSSPAASSAPSSIDLSSADSDSASLTAPFAPPAVMPSFVGDAHVAHSHGAIPSSSSLASSNVGTSRPQHPITVARKIRKSITIARHR